MYRVLLLGRLDRTAEELYKCLYRNYHVQFCTETSETMQNMMAGKEVLMQKRLRHHGACPYPWKECLG